MNAPTLLAVFSFFYPLPAKLKRNLMWHIPSVTIQALTLRILTLKTNQGTKFGAIKKPMFSLFDLMGK